MNLRQYILIFLFGSAIAWAAWATVILNIDPVSAGVGGLILFYGTFSVASIGTFTAIGTLARSVRESAEVDHVIKTSLRQSVLFTVLLVGSMILLSQGLLNWWTSLLLLAVIGLVEFFSVSVTVSES